VLIENVLATFEMDEILYELREHSAGLNCGIWDYSASFVNKFGECLKTHVCMFLSAHGNMADVDLASVSDRLPSSSRLTIEPFYSWSVAG